MTDGEIRLNIMNNLKKIMGTGNRPKITCKKLAEKCNLPFHTVRSARFRGQGGILTLYKIADALHVTIDDLIKY